MKMNLPTKITISRLFLLPFFILSLIYYSPNSVYLRFVALGIFVISCLTDFLDGYLARRNNLITDKGRILDAASDKIFIVSSFVVLAFFSRLPEEVHLPYLVVLVIIGRDVGIVLGALFIYFRFKELYVFPGIMGKISIFFEMATIISILLLFKYSFIIWNLTVIFVILSGVGYLLRALNRFGRKGKVAW